MKHLLLLITILFSINSYAEEPTRQDMEAKAASAARTHVSLGSSYLSEGKNQFAKEEASLALEIKPDYAPAFNLLGLVNFKEKDLLKAKSSYLKSLSIDPVNGDTNNNYAILLCEEGEYKKSVEYFGKAMADPTYYNTELTLTNAGICLFRAKDYSASTKFFDGTLQLNPLNVVATFYIAKILETEKKYEAAFNKLEKVHSLTAPTAESYFLGAALALKLNKTEDFNVYKEKLFRDFPESSEAKTIISLSK